MPLQPWFRRFVSVLLLWSALLWAAPPPQLPDPKTLVLNLQRLEDLDALVERLTEKQVVFVGETHDQYAHHLNQLAIIRGLWKRGKALAIGMECFQQPFQADLDAFIRGEIDEKTLLRRTEYFDRWRYDYRLYQPILRFARDQGIPLLALNLEREITDRVKAVGIAGLTAAEQARLPQRLEREPEAYRQRIQAIFQHHPKAKELDFERFLAVQVLWDESMAERAADYLRQYPDRSLVILAGSGHLEYGQGIPDRLQRRLPVDAAIILNGTDRIPSPNLADYLLYPQAVPLPPAGMLGVLLDLHEIKIKGFVEDSGAAAAGLKEGDRILQIDGQPIRSYADVRLALLNRQPGEKIRVQVERPRLLGEPARIRVSVVLRGDPAPALRSPERDR